MTIPEFSDAERAAVAAALHGRYGHPVEVRLADVEMQLDPREARLTTCPTLYWEARRAGFVVARMTDGRYRALFFYSDDPQGMQYGTGRSDYDDLLECVTTVLRLQADHEKERRGVGSGDTAVDLEQPEESE